MSTPRQQSRTFFIFLIGLLIVASVGISYVGTADDCGDGPKEWMWFPPRWECGTGF